MKKLGILTVLLIIAFTAGAQTQKTETEGFSFGAKLGFSSTLPIVNSLTIEGVEAQNVNLQYKVGYLAALFCRINIDRFFIMPGVEWNHADGSINYSLPDGIDQTYLKSTSAVSSEGFNVETNTIEVPVLLGFNMVKSYPYCLSFQAGPKLRYRVTEDFSPVGNPESFKLSGESKPYGVNAVTGVSVSIWRMFFDFYYEFGINQSKTDFSYQTTLLPYESNFSLKNRTNKMSFSLGILF